MPSSGSSPSRERRPVCRDLDTAERQRPNKPKRIPGDENSRGRPGYRGHRNARYYYSDESYENNGDKDTAAVTYRQEADEQWRIEIRSQFLTKAIARVNKYSPTEQVPGFFTEREPFPTLFYHIEEVKSEIAKLNDQSATREFEEMDRGLEKWKPFWKKAREVDFDSGYVSYNMLWRLFRPGDHVFHEDEIGSLWKFGFVKFDYTNQQERDYEDGYYDNPRMIHYVQFVTWGLRWKHVEETLSSESRIFRWDEFSGQILISSLPIFPLKYWHGQSQSAQGIRKSLAERGRKWWKFITSPTSYLNFNGIAFAKRVDERYVRRNYANEVRIRPPGTEADFRRRTKINGKVIIDHDSKMLWHLQLRPSISVERGRAVTTESDCGWGDLPVTADLTDEQAGFCPPNIGCHRLSDFEQYLVAVDHLAPVPLDTGGFDRLVMEEKKKDILKGLVGHHYSNRENASDTDLEGDLIEGKGKGLIILLHGPPGVGKTLTAECISRAIGKPLIALSIGDLVWDESRLQSRLQEEFTRATDWDAILLLDEADVVLEARSFEDVRRNGMVSVFLRQLEYYQGVLFLTSNRISTMDIAFQSRIQIGISFKNMTPSVRSQIWDQLLSLNGRDRMIGSTAVEDVKRKLGKLDLNGRQIRNVLNVADGLAFNEYGESGKLKYRHIQEAVENAVEFQNMLEEAKSNMKSEQTVWAMYRGGDNEF